MSDYLDASEDLSRALDAASDAWRKASFELRELNIPAPWPEVARQRFIDRRERRWTWQSEGPPPEDAA